MTLPYLWISLMITLSADDYFKVSRTLRLIFFERVCGTTSSRSATQEFAIF